MEESIQKLRESASQEVIEIASPLKIHNKEKKGMKSNKRILKPQDTLE